MQRSVTGIGGWVCATRHERRRKHHDLGAASEDKHVQARHCHAKHVAQEAEPEGHIPRAVTDVVEKDPLFERNYACGAAVDTISGAVATRTSAGLRISPTLPAQGAAVGLRTHAERANDGGMKRLRSLPRLHPSRLSSYGAGRRPAASREVVFTQCLGTFIRFVLEPRGAGHVDTVQVSAVRPNLVAPTSRDHLRMRT